MWLLLACTPAPKDGPDDPVDTGTSAVTGDTSSAHSGPSVVAHSAAHSGAHSGTGTTGGTGDSAVPTFPEPDFHLVDLNPTSPTFGATMSPRDELRKVSGWYFTHAS
jgi:hypothetical protein